MRTFIYIYFPCFLYHPSPESSVHLVFTCCLFPGLNLVLGLILFQLLSLLFEIHSLNMLGHQIAWFLPITIWKITFSDYLIHPKFPRHLIIRWWTLHCTWTMSLPKPCTRCTTELHSFWGYWCNRSFVIIIISIKFINICSRESQQCFSVLNLMLIVVKEFCDWELFLLEIFLITMDNNLTVLPVVQILWNCSGGSKIEIYFIKLIFRILPNCS